MSDPVEQKFRPIGKAHIRNETLGSEIFWVQLFRGRDRKPGKVFYIPFGKTTTLLLKSPEDDPMVTLTFSLRPNHKNIQPGETTIDGHSGRDYPMRIGVAGNRLSFIDWNAPPSSPPQTYEVYDEL
jgi:hypothetical protein